MGASDYQVGNAPAGASYAAPLVGFQLGQNIAGLPDQFMKGRENSRKIEMEDMFRKEDIPKNPDGSPDLNAIIDKGAKIGGLPFVQGMIPFLNDMALGKKAAEVMTGSGAPPAPGAPATGPTSAAPPQQQPAPQQQPRLAASGADIGDQGKPTLRSTIAELAGGKDVSPAAIGSIARQLRLSPDAPINPDQITQLKGLLGKAAGGAQLGGQEPEDSGAAGPQNGTTAAPFMAGGASGSPAPQAGAAGGTFADRFAGQPPSGLAPGTNMAAIQKEETRATNLRAAAAYLSSTKNPERAAPLLKEAEAADARAKEMRTQFGKAAELTNEFKNSSSPIVQAVKRQEEVQKADIKTSEKKYDGLQNLGQVGQIGNQKLDRIRSVMSDPDFMSGAGNKIALAFKQWNATLGGNPNAAQPMEEFNKTAQQLLSDDIKAMGASGAGPVRVAEVNIMKQATANLGISPATNRYLVEEAYRVHDDNIAVARMAQEYKAKNGYLDAGWDKIRDQYYQQHPLFTKEELADPRLVSPPMLPRSMAADPAKAKAWERSQGLKPGDPIKTEDGKIRWVR